MRPWAETFPWAALVRAIEHRVATRCPKQAPRGRQPLPLRVLCALELRKHALGAADAEMCPRVRPDCAVMSACGLRESQGKPAHAHCVLPETLCACRRRLDAARMEACIAMPAAAAMAAGLVSPAPLVIATVPRAPGRHRVTEATTRYHAQKQRVRSSTTSPNSAAAGAPPSTATPQASHRRAHR